MTSSNTLRHLWFKDQKISFALGLIVGTDLTKSVRSLLKVLSRASKYLVNESQSIPINFLSETTLNLANSINDKTLRFICTILPNRDLSESLHSYIHRLRAEFLKRSLGEISRISVDLVQMATTYIQRQNVNFVDFLFWMSRNFKQKKGNECRKLIRSLATDSIRQCQVIIESFSDANAENYDGNKQVEQITELHSLVKGIKKRSGEVEFYIPIWWTQICFSLLDSIFCWPLLVASSGERSHGISLPVGFILDHDKRPNKLSIRSTPTSPIKWDDEWTSSFLTGLKCAKDLWKSQNGRLANDHFKEKVLNCGVLVNLEHASEIVEDILGGGDAYILTGQSSDLYWSQVSLSHILSDRHPTGVATGKLLFNAGEWSIQDVSGISEKLIYANAAGFSRVIIPPEKERGPNAQLETEDSVVTFLKRLRISSSRKTVEINRCVSARVAADAMQVIGWRRVTFSRTPELQSSFSFHLRRLFIKAQIEEKQYLRRDDLEFYKKYFWKKNESKELDKLDSWFTSKDRAIKYIDGHKLPNLHLLGKWLAYQDHKAREKSSDGYRGPGLGISCFRTRPDEREARLWSALSHQLDVNPEWWPKFRWGDYDTACHQLSNMLSNFSGNAEVSRTPSPDVLIIVDEGDLTQQKSNRIFPSDFGVQWMDVLNARHPDVSRPDILSSRLSENQGRGINGTKIIIVKGWKKAKRNKLDQDNALTKDELEKMFALSKFRFSFSKQSAYAVIRSCQPTERFSWTDLEALIEKYISGGILRRVGGKYYVSRIIDYPEHVVERYKLAEIHYSCAISLVPICAPHENTIATNIDRTFDQDALLEARWHLKQALSFTSFKHQKSYQKYKDALKNISVIDPTSDWDLVKVLSNSSATQLDAVNMGRELINIEKENSPAGPHSSRYSLQLNTIGKYINANRDRENLVADLMLEVELLSEEALESIKLSCPRDNHLNRQYRKFYSEFLATISGHSYENSEVLSQIKVTAESYLQHTISSVVKKDFLPADLSKRKHLVNYPVSRSWLHKEWSNKNYNDEKRRMTAYAASRISAARIDINGEKTLPWADPYIAFFALSHPNDVSPAQIYSMVDSLRMDFRKDEVGLEEFGKIVMDRRPYLQYNRSKKSISKKSSRN